MADHLYVGVMFPYRDPDSLALQFYKVFSYDPSTRTPRLESPRSNRLLLRRYAVVHKARDCDIFGILVGTLGIGMNHEHVACHLGLISQLYQRNIYPSLDA